MSPAILVKAAASILTNEKSRKAVGWVLTAVLSPIILLLAFFCTTFSGGAEHNRTVVDLCFHGGAVPEGAPAEYQAYIQEMRDSFALLDAAMQAVEGQMEEGDGLDDIRVKAVFFALYFGTDDPAAHAGQTFVDCFVTYEERTRTVTTVDEEGNEVETQETYTMAVPISDLQQIWQNLQRLTGTEVSPEQQANADSVYNIVKYGVSTAPTCPSSGRTASAPPLVPGGRAVLPRSLVTGETPSPGRPGATPAWIWRYPPAPPSGPPCPAPSPPPSTTAAMVTM